MKPIIGITVECKHDPEDERSGGNFSLNWNYADMISKAGGVPIVIPPMADVDEIAPMLDGWLIPGGNDIDASRFGEENHPAVELQDPNRFECESKLFQAIPKDLPILGICYGCQFLNVIRGGSLHQHLPDIVQHGNHSGGTLQEYLVSPGSKTSEVLGNSAVSGRSYHHQSVHRLGQGLVSTAQHEDGTIEAVEAIDHPWLVGVQWHPERTPAHTESINLFRNFVEAARRFREERMSQ